MNRRQQAGATAVEFALALLLFLTFTLGLLDFARMLWTWNAANEATRWGARTAVVCPQGATAVLRNMQGILPQLTNANVRVQWFGADGRVDACNASDCAAVQVGIQDLDYVWISPIGFTSTRLFPMPAFATYLPRESMGQVDGSAAICD